MGIIYNAPANQSTTDRQLKDYGPKATKGLLSGAAAFVNDAPNKNGNSLNFPDGASAATVYDQVLNVDSNFTVSLWVKVPKDQYNGIAALAVWGEAGARDRASVSTNITKNVWHHIAATKKGLTITLYVDEKEKGSVDVWNNEISAFAITESNGDDLACASVSDVMIYDYCLNLTEIKMAAATNSVLTYSLDGTDFKTYNVYVSDSDGLLDRPKMKTPTSLSWADEHGTFVDLDSPKLENREITLKCFIYADDKLSFSQKVSQFLQLFDKGGIHRLQVDITETTPLVYEVYAPNAVAVDKRWHEGMMVGEFSLKLVEPTPVKRVLKTTAKDTDKSVSITLRQASTAYHHLYTVYWGDGESEEFTAASIALSHTYSDNGTYYIVIAGDIDNISSMVTSFNVALIWDKI